MSARRTGLLLGAAGIAFVAVTGTVFGWGDGGGDVISATILAAALGAAPSHPRATWALAAAVLLVTGARGKVPGGDETMADVLIAAHAFGAGRWDTRWGGLAAMAVLIVVGEANSALAHSSTGPYFFIVPAGWGAGRALRERAVVAAQLAERARELEAEREAHAALSVRYERARIASELHDIVAHAISVMVVQAAAGQRLAAHDPEATAEAFGAIAGAARQAEEDMGRLVALLGDEGAIGPAPDLSLVEELVRRATGSGLDVRLRLEGEREGLPAPLVDAAYHVVQEGLTNALRYAAGAPISVLVGGGREALVVEVVNAPATREAELAGAGTGNGLRGLRERVGACGGTVEAGPATDGGWRLAARLPRAGSSLRVTAPSSVHLRG